MSNILNDLNSEQKEAVLHTQGSLLVLAGAGTGKTRVLTSKIAYLLENAQAFPSEILAVTFTNKASKEMKERVFNSVLKDTSAIWLGTFHSIANRILRQHAELFGLTTDFTIIDSDDQSRLMKQILLDYEIDIKNFPVKNYVNKINEWKDKGITHSFVSNMSIDLNYYPEIKDIYKIYTERCKKLNICDFGDLLLYNVQLFKEQKDILKSYINKFKYILVDEYQDTNNIQHTWLKMISGVEQKKTINITCVGDDDQSIYGWRGAEIKNILTFESDFKDTKIIRLERNYRSTTNILEVASSVIANNKNRHVKKLWTNKENNGEKISINCFNRDKDETYFIADTIKEIINKEITYKDIAILVRAGYQTRIFEEIFIGQSIPYKIVGGFKFYDRKEIKDCIAYLKLVKNPSDLLAFERIINTPRRGIGSVTLNLIIEELKNGSNNILETCEDLCIAGIIKGKTAENLMKFSKMILSSNAEISKTNHISLAKEIIYSTGYIDSLIAEKTDEARTSIENINEFIRGLSEFSGLTEFLEYASLVNDNNNYKDENSINIMTIHSAKGLEFDTVFLPGWEEGIFPSPRSIDENNGLEEERRLAYVAITRAKNKILISFAKTRYEYGETKMMKPSRFIKEIPEKNCIISENILDENESYNENNSEVEYYNKPLQKYNNYYSPKNTFKNNNSSEIVKNITKKVMHEKFGEGLVIKTDGEKLTIIFKDVGLKIIMANFVKFI